MLFSSSQDISVAFIELRFLKLVNHFAMRGCRAFHGIAGKRSSSQSNVHAKPMVARDSSSSNESHDVPMY